MSQWTKEAPTEPGYYWWRLNTRFDVGRIKVRYPGERVCACFAGDQTNYEVNALQGEWWPERLTVPDTVLDDESDSGCVK